MSTITIKGMKELQANLQDFSERRMAAAVATALTRTAVKVRAEMATKVQQTFDRPTPYTMSQLRYVPATAQQLASAVGFGIVAIQDIHGRVMRYQDLGPGSTPASRYLAPHIDGGPRSQKRLELALRALGVLPDRWLVTPAPGAPLDAYGNVSRGTVVQILSQLRVQLVAGTTRNMSSDARKQIAAQRKAGGRYFVIAPGARARPGVYQREFVGRNVTPVFWFVSGAAYRKRFDFQAEAQDMGQRILPDEMQRSVAEHIARIASRGP